MKKIVLASLAVALGWSGTAFAQSEEDALRYSQLGVAGSARTQGIGGAQTALGADVSNLFGNPAGIGMFRRSEVSLTPALQYSSSDARTNGSSQSDERNILTIPQASFVLSNRRGDDDTNDWRGINFGMGVTRLNNFNQRVSYRNTSAPPNTIVDYFAERAAGRNQSALDAEFGNVTSLEGLAYSTYLINFRDEFGNPVSDARALYSLGDIDQSEEIERRGSQNQIDLGVGTSYRDKIYLGASVGIMSTHFTQESFFSESGYYVDQYDEATGDVITDGDYSLNLYDDFTTRGTGVNLKVGIIARPIDALRIGASIQTPTVYNFTDTYQRTLNTTSVNPNTGSPENYDASELPGEFSYRLTTPFRASGGLAFFIGKYGFITGDLEFVDYAGSRYKEDSEFGSGSSNYFTSLNKGIENTYQSAVNYKIGAEGRYDVFRIRAGYAHSGDPYKSAALDGAVKSVTAGVGIRLQNYYLDLAFVSSKSDTRYSPYQFATGGGEPIVDISNKQNSALLTVGYNF